MAIGRLEADAGSTRHAERSRKPGSRRCRFTLQTSPGNTSNALRSRSFINAHRHQANEQGWAYIPPAPTRDHSVTRVTSSSHLGIVFWWTRSHPLGISPS